MKKSQARRFKTKQAYEFLIILQTSSFHSVYLSIFSLPQMTHSNFPTMGAVHQCCSRYLVTSFLNFAVLISTFPNERMKLFLWDCFVSASYFETVLFLLTSTDFLITINFVHVSHSGCYSDRLPSLNLTELQWAS